MSEDDETQRRTILSEEERAEVVRRNSERRPRNDRYDWEPEGVTERHPGGTGSKRVRPASILSTVPRGERLAELVCGARGRRPRVVAIVRRKAVDGYDVVTEHGTDRSGANVTIFCVCERRHFVDGGRLRSEVLALPPSPRKVPTLDVRTL